MTKKIMVVDDDPVTVKYIVALLRDSGYETCAAADGLEAYEMIKSEKPDLITLDLEMPEEWGTRFYRRLTKEEEFKDIPVVVISGLAGRHLSIRKAVAFLAKPFEPTELLKIIRNSVGK